MKPMTLGALFVLTLAAAGCNKAGAREGLPPAKGEGAPPAPSVPVLASASPSETVSSGSEQLVVTGTARAVHEAKLGPKASGVIAAMLVEEGDRVKKGQLLFRLDSASQALVVSQAQAGLAAAEVQHQNAELELNRTKPLLEKGSIAPAVYDQLKARYDATKAGVDQAKAALGSAKRMAADTGVTSPISGIVAGRYANVGETVTMMPPTTVLLVQDISSLEVRARVPETSLKRLRPGSTILVRFPAIGAERRVPIERINPSVDPMTRTIEVIALVPNADAELKAGMLVEVDFRAEPTGEAAAASASASANPGRAAASPPPQRRRPTAANTQATREK